MVILACFIFEPSGSVLPLSSSAAEKPSVSNDDIFIEVSVLSVLRLKE